MFVIRSVGPANYGILAAAVTALVVVLTSFAGANPEEAIVLRGFHTVVGGALALVAYIAWPTWERCQAPQVIARMLDAFRKYFDAVMASYVDPSRYNSAHLGQLRLDARLTRSNAEASVERLPNEPRTVPDELDRATGLLANSHRFVNAIMSLEAQLLEDPPQASTPLRASLQTFARDVDGALVALARALDVPARRLDHFPNLSEDQRLLAESVEPQGAGGGRAQSGDYRLAVLAAEADRITDSINTMAQLLGGARGAARPAA